MLSFWTKKSYHFSQQTLEQINEQRPAPPPRAQRSMQAVHLRLPPAIENVSFARTPPIPLGSLILCIKIELLFGSR